ncbi:hypothetical protein [Nocardioides houyundeii]|uniref:hypothetical protein n=1 Tax=Nocardioides houyundeii TaxID=2045452 RepID=UPI0013B41440|nr:hypothetical protein [Nocardioides houyundeii]
MNPRNALLALLPAVVGLNACSAESGGDTATEPRATVTVTATVTNSATPEPPSAPEGFAGELKNPVSILRKIQGCTIPAGTETGDRDIHGSLYADCELSEVVNVTVRTYAVDPLILPPDTYPDLVPDDSNKVIFGPDFTVNIWGSPEYLAEVPSVETIAAQVGGNVHTP